MIFAMFFNLIICSHLLYFLIVLKYSASRSLFCVPQTEVLHVRSADGIAYSQRQKLQSCPYLSQQQRGSSSDRIFHFGSELVQYLLLIGKRSYIKAVIGAVAMILFSFQSLHQIHSVIGRKQQRIQNCHLRHPQNEKELSNILL